MRSSAQLAFLLAATLGVGALATPARAGDASVEDAGAPDAAAPFVPDEWELGRPTTPDPRPRLPLRACAAGVGGAVCVHGPSGAERDVLDVLHTAARAERSATGALRLPAPDRDVFTNALDFYLVARDDDDATVRLAGRDPLASFDRASGFVELPRGLSGCARDGAIARAVLRAIGLRVAPAASEAVAIATAQHLAQLVEPCLAGRLDDVAAFQREPSRALFDAGERPGDRRFVRGAATFFDWAAVRFGSEPGGLVRASLALMPTRSGLDAARFTPRPDVLDVLRTSFKEILSVGATGDDLFYRFAGVRATFGPAADPTTLPSARAFGEAGRVALDFTIDWPKAPRRFSSLKPIAPTGMSVLAVRRTGAPAGARLRIEADWEEHARLRWMAIKLGANGAPRGTVLVPSTPKATSAQATITELEDTDVVLVVAENAGDFARPFDPDEGPWEPHAYLVTLAAE